MIAHKLLVSHRQRYEYGLHKLTQGGGAGNEGTGSQHRFFPSKVLQLSVAEISNVLPTSRDERCRPQKYLLLSKAPAEAHRPASARESRRGKRSESSAGDGLDWWGRRKVEQSPVVARGKAGFLLDGKSPGSAFRVTCLGRGHCHRPRSRGTSRGQRGRGFSRSPCSGSLPCLAGPAA